MSTPDNPRYGVIGVVLTPEVDRFLKEISQAAIYQFGTYSGQAITATQLEGLETSMNNIPLNAGQSNYLHIALARAKEATDSAYNAWTFREENAYVYLITAVSAAIAELEKASDLLGWDPTRNPSDHPHEGRDQNG